MLNSLKARVVLNLCQAYAKEKRYWVERLKSWTLQARLDYPRSIRDEAVKLKYRSSFGLQARHWKLAFEDAVSTWDKYWQALFVQVRHKIAAYKSLSEVERHYAYWLLSGHSESETKMNMFSHIFRNSASAVWR